MVKINKDIWEEIQRKIKFVAAVGAGLTSVPEATSVEKVEYQLVAVPVDGDDGYYREYLVVTYKGGAIAVRNCTYNSEGSIFEELAKLIFGGYYDEVAGYRNAVAKSTTDIEIVEE